MVVVICEYLGLENFNWILLLTIRCFSAPGKVSLIERSVEVVVPLSTTMVCFCCPALVCLGLSSGLVLVVMVSILVFLFLENFAGDQKVCTQIVRSSGP